MSATSTTAIAAKLESTSLDDSQGFRPDTGEGEVAAPSVEATPQPSNDGKRLHVRNIAYATTEGELKEFFSGFEVTNTKIPINPRSTHSLGYAFVDLATAEQAQKAIEELNNKELNGRVIAVVIANGVPNQARSRNVRGRGRGRGRGRAGRSSAGTFRNNEDKGEQSGRDGLPLGDITNKSSSADANKDESTTEYKKGGINQRRKRGAPENGVLSDVKIMVANIPFDTQEDDLFEYFKEYDPKTISIALRPIPFFMVKKLAERKEPRMGRGFAFITLASNEMQQKACKEKNGTKFQDREIVVKVAIDVPDKVENKSEEAAAKDEAETTKETEAPKPVPTDA